MDLIVKSVLLFLGLANIVVGGAFMYDLYKSNMTFFKGIKTLLLAPIWFLFIDEWKKKKQEDEE